MSDPVSNVRVVSNIYPVTTVRQSNLPGLPLSRFGVCDDPQFRRRVRGKAALKSLAEYKLGLDVNERGLLERFQDANLITSWQVEAFWKGEGNGRCVDCTPGERPIGLRREGDKYCLVNRCEKLHCRARRPKL